MKSGEDNPQAKLSDDEVELLRGMWEADHQLPRAQRLWSARALAAKFEISVRHFWYIVGHHRR